MVSTFKFQLTSNKSYLHEYRKFYSINSENIFSCCEEQVQSNKWQPIKSVCQIKITELLGWMKSMAVQLSVVVQPLLYVKISNCTQTCKYFISNYNFQCQHSSTNISSQPHKVRWNGHIINMQMLCSTLGLQNLSASVLYKCNFVLFCIVL